MSGSKKYNGVNGLLIGRPTITSAMRASVVDENKRKERAKEKETGTPVPASSTRHFERVKITCTINTNARIVSKPPKPASVPMMKKAGGVHSSGALEKNFARSLSMDDRETTARPTARSVESSSPSNCKLTRSLSNDGSSSLQKTSDRSASVRVTSQGTSHTRYDTPSSSYTKTYSARLTSATRNSKLRDNLDFYLGKIKSKPAPTGVYVEEMLKWKGDYEILERNHRYIQWLFPIPEGSGFNIYAQPLTEYEAEEIKHNDKALQRVLNAYKMMLDFYGMKLVDENVGTVERSTKNYLDRYKHLNRSRHNLLRITRIIKSIGELGYERFQARWVDFLYEESVVKKVLDLSKSCFNHWIDAINDDAEREVMYRKIHGLTWKIDEPMNNANSEGEEEEEIETWDSTEKGATGDKIYTTKKVSSLSEEKAITSHDTGYDPLNENDPKGATGGMIYTTTEVPSKSERTTTIPHDTVHGPFSEIDPNISSVHEDVSYREFCKDGENRDELFNDKGYEDDAEDHSNHETLQQLQITQLEAGWPWDNLKFYRNQIHSRPPPGFTIETILRHAGDYKFLDSYPYFIQWLFPTPSRSRVNEEAQPLHQREADEIIKDDMTFSLVFRAYVLILDYYGMQIVDGVTGQLNKSKKWKLRWKDLNASGNHEFMRITRILISLGELGYERYQVPLIDMFIKHGMQTDKYIKGLTWDHVAYWINCIKDKGEKEAMFAQYQRFLFKSSRSERQVRLDDRVQHTHQHMDVNPPDWTGISQYLH